MEREFKSKKRYLIAFAIGTFIFLLIILSSYSISYWEFQRVSNLQISTSFDIFKDKLDYSLFDLGMCSNESFKKVSSDLGFQGRIIDDLERKIGKLDPRVIERKKFYTLVELEHFELVNLLNKQCNLNMQTILFFYSNDENSISKSEELGRLLGTLSGRHPDSLMIYSFDYNLDSDLIGKLKTKYKINEPFTIIINEKDKLVNPKEITELESYLK
ncbi:MAG: hypothetical protein AABX30_03395 [Nanoarchaeota archaeon]